MSFSIDHILNGNLSIIVEYLNEGPVIETLLAINANNTSTTLNESQLKNLSETTKDIDQGMMIQNSAKLLKSVINNVVNKNQASLLQSFSALNDISLENATIQNDLNLKDIDQENTVTLDAKIKNVQTVLNDISTQITSEVSTTFSKAASSSAKSGTSTSIGETLGKAMDAISSIGTSFIDNASKVIDGACGVTSGNKTKKETKTNTENIIKDTFKLKDTFELTSNNEFNDAVSNQLSTENLSECSQQTQAKNKLDLKGINVKGNANITNIKQKNFVTAALDCAFNQEITNKLATIFVTNYQNVVDSMVENSTVNNSGDILAAGTAGAAMICAAGSAVSTAAQGMGTGISEGAQGLGSGVGNAFSAVGNLYSSGLIFCCICICCILIGLCGAYAMYSSNSMGNIPGITNVPEIHEPTNVDKETHETST